MGGEQAQDDGESRSARAEVTLATLVSAVQRLSMAASVAEIQAVVRAAAGVLVRADGATFVLRDGDHCFHADDDDPEHLWDGERRPLDSCVSGWTILNGRPAVIEDIRADERVGEEAYLPRSAMSLVVVPIRTIEPLGTIGMYWSHRHVASAHEVNVARALADSTAVALERVSTLDQLERAVILSETDALTGLPNRRAWDEAMALAVHAPSHPFCVAVIDIDGFKSYNDAHGHPAGDALLRQTAQAWLSALRPGDLLARYGGDEFAVLMHDCDGPAARIITDRLRSVAPEPVTASAGVAPHRPAELPVPLVARADTALYAAKRAGGNQTERAAS
jgi:diguanylate cyclase (GGDEF)-like protein